MTLPPDLTLLDSAGKDALILALFERLNELYLLSASSRQPSRYPNCCAGFTVARRSSSRLRTKGLFDLERLEPLSEVLESERRTG